MTTHLTPDAKAALSRTIRELRARLVRDIHDEAESVYRLSIKDAKQAKLGEAARVRRERLTAFLDERCRALPVKEREAARARLRAEAEAEAAHTLIHRLVLIRHLEALGLSRPLVVTGGWKSPGYREFIDYAPELSADPTDPTEGFDHLLSQIFDELAVDLPGLFGEVGLTRLFPVPAATLREVIERLDAPELSSAWGDDTTLGWVYQYWNDPSREALDAKIAGGGKVEPHEIASKTQMFTERYMVEWLLQNSLGLLWLSMCRKNGWTPDAEAVIPELDARRAEWREKRERGEVALDALMPVEEGLWDRWKYYVPQPIPQDAVEKAPGSVRDLKILDPACGSGHFLVIAFDLLVELYREEAGHRGVTWEDGEIARWIVEENLHGVDIDPRAVQIAAAGLFLKAKRLARGVTIRRLNLVAPRLLLGKLPKDDPALVELRRGIKEEAGIPEAVTEKLVSALAGVDHLGTLLKVDGAVAEAIEGYEKAVKEPAQANLSFEGGTRKKPSTKPPLRGFEEAKATVLGKLERFLSRHMSEAELGIRLGGEQLAAGLRFMRMVKEGSYDLVIGNPPYQGTSRMADAAYVKKTYPRGKADLYAAFLERGLSLARTYGVSAMLTMRGWMFLGQFAELREDLLRFYDLRSLGDVDRGAFEDIPDETVAVAMSVFLKVPPTATKSIALQPTPPSDKSRDGGRTLRKRAALLAQVGRFEFQTRGFEAIEGEPLVYWWSTQALATYAAAPKLGDTIPAKQGMATSNNARFLREPWELQASRMFLGRTSAKRTIVTTDFTWAPYVKGAGGHAWMEPLGAAILWRRNGLEAKLYNEHICGSFSKNIKNEHWFFKPGCAYNTIGNAFSARLLRFASVFDVRGSCVFPSDPEPVLCLMNSKAACAVLESLNPGVNFQVGDVNRLPIFPIENADDIYETLDGAFTEHERARETSVEYMAPGPSPWRYAQEWAQRAVDRPAGEPLPPYEPVHDAPEPIAFVSHAFGLAMGRFPLAAGPGREIAEPGALADARTTLGNRSEGLRNGPAGLRNGPEGLPSGSEGMPDGVAGFVAPPAGDANGIPNYIDRSASSSSGIPDPGTGRGEPPAHRQSSASGSASSVSGISGSPDAAQALGPVWQGPGAAWQGGGAASRDSGPVREALPPGVDPLPAGILYLSPTDRDLLAHAACAPLLAAWSTHGASIDPKLDLRAFLRTRFFDHHRKLYESRPIYFPLSSSKRTFVAWISIHRWTETTLSTLLADHLLPERRALEGQIDDLRKARGSTDGKQRSLAEKRFGEVQKLLEELTGFVDLVTACAEKGPPAPGSTPEREADARYVPDLDDGVMVNSAALWPLLEPQWKEPKKWWKELVSASGQKDYDWSHLAARYFPRRVADKCAKDPSLAVAHGCFWRLHPARAYAWELRLQDEIKPDFNIEESGADEARARFLKERKKEAREIEKAEQRRRERKALKAGREEDAQGELPFGEERGASDEGEGD